VPVIDGISVVSVYDPDTGDTIEINKIIANTFDFSKLDMVTGELSPSGGVLYKGDSSSCSFSYLDPDGSITYQLETWKVARTRVSLVAIGPSVVVQWYEKDHISVNPSSLGGVTRGRGDMHDFAISREGHGTHQIYKRANLISHLGWIDSDSNNIADGYTNTSTSPSFSSGAQAVADASPSVGIYADIVFPYVSNMPSLTLSVNITDLHSETSSAQFRLEQLNFAGSGVGSNVISHPTATGRTSLTMSSFHADLYKLRVGPIMTPSTITLTQDCASKDPALRVDAGTTYTQR